MTLAMDISYHYESILSLMRLYWTGTSWLHLVDLLVWKKA